MTYNTDTTHRDSNYVPNDIQFEVYSGGATEFSLVNESEQTDFWIHFRYSPGRMYVGGADGYVLEFKDDNDDVIAYLDMVDDSLRATAVGDTTENGNTVFWTSYVPHTIDVNVELTGGDIIVTFYLNGSQVSQATAA